MGRDLLTKQADSLTKAAGTVDMTKYNDVKKNLKGTPTLLTQYVDAVKKYDPEGCADRLFDCGSVLKGIARKLPTRSASPPKSNPSSRRLKRQAKS